MNYVRRRLSGSGRAGEARVARRGAHDGCILSYGSREIPEAANATFHTDKKTEPVEERFSANDYVTSVDTRPDRVKSRLISIRRLDCTYKWMIVGTYTMGWPFFFFLFSIPENYLLNRTS